MTSLTICATLLVFFSAAYAKDFFQQVEGKCSDLPTVPKYDYRKVATGEWYGSYLSFGNEGDKCASGHLVARKTKNYVDILLFDSQNNRYLNIPDDLIYHKHKPGVYSTLDGGIVHKVASDSQNYLFSVSCTEEDGQTQVMVIFVTRERELDKKYEAIYNKTAAVLAEKKLLPKMHKVENVNCPPLDNVVQLSP